MAGTASQFAATYSYQNRTVKFCQQQHTAGRAKKLRPLSEAAYVIKVCRTYGRTDASFAWLVWSSCVQFCMTLSGIATLLIAEPNQTKAESWCDWLIHLNCLPLRVDRVSCRTLNAAGRSKMRVNFPSFFGANQSECHYQPKFCWNGQNQSREMIGIVNSVWTKDRSES